MQTGIFAPELGLGNLTVGLNGPEYEVNGIEMQVVWAPIDGLTVDAAASYNKTELTNSPALINNFGTPETNPDYGQPVTEACLQYSAGECLQSVEVVDVFGHKGDELANSPKLQWNIRGRYDWDMGEYRPFVMAAVQYQDSSLSSATAVNQYKMPSWTTFDASIGVNKDAVEPGTLWHQPDGREQEPVHHGVAVHRRRGAHAPADHWSAHRLLLRQVSERHGPAGKPAGPSIVGHAFA